MRKWKWQLLIVIVAVYWMSSAYHGQGSIPSESQIASLFPAQWDAPPDQHSCVLAVCIAPVPENAFITITSQLMTKYIHETLRAPKYKVPQPAGKEPLQGFKNKYARDLNGGTAYWRIEYDCSSEKDLLSVRKRYETILSDQMVILKVSADIESVVLVNEGMQKKLKLPNQAVQRTRTASAVHGKPPTGSTDVPASADGKR
jgi:hypothetical protein